jgi:hypothetical protein
MSAPGERFQRGHPLPSFEGEAQAFPELERAGGETALAIAIAEAATAAADYATQHGLGTMTYEVTRIRIVVAPNPGPTTYRAVITPGG